MTQQAITLRSLSGNRIFIISALVQLCLAAVVVGAQAWFLYAADEQHSPAGVYEMASLLVVTAFALAVGVAGRGGFATRAPLLAAAAIFGAIVAHEWFFWNLDTAIEDWIALCLWIAASVGLVFLSRRRPLPRFAGALLTVATLAKILSIGADLADEGGLGLTNGDAALSWTYLLFTALSAATIQLGLLSLAADPGGSIEQRFGLSREHGFGALLAGWIADARYAAWRRVNPDKTYGDYYGERLAARLERGGSHKTLGAVAHWERLKGGGSRDWAREEFARRGASHREWFFSRGVPTDFSCVDYGCGSLRVGQHFIRRLEPGRWMGLDVVDRFWTDGLTMIEPEVVSEKRPAFSVIGSEGLAAAAARSPDLVYSTAVMQHVPPGELEIYLGNIAGIATRGVACANFKRTQRTTRIGPNAWSHSAGDVMRAARAVAPDFTIAIEDDGAKPGEDFAKATLVMSRDPELVRRWARRPLDLRED